jgi:hypothetical protein
VQHVAPDPEDPGGDRVAVGRVGGEAPALLEGARVVSATSSTASWASYVRRVKKTSSRRPSRSYAAARRSASRR